MNRYFALALFVACAASGPALADDITIDPHPFVSTASRAQVMAELQQYRQSGVNPWADDYNRSPRPARAPRRGDGRVHGIAQRGRRLHRRGQRLRYLAHAADDPARRLRGGARRLMP